MKKYNIQNYLRYKNDLETSLERIDAENEEIPKASRSRDELIILYMPIVEQIARKFSTSDQASGVLSINDMIQEGNIGLIYAVDKIDWVTVDASEEPEKTLYSFLKKRIRGAIRRAIDINRGDIRIPEHKLNEIRKIDDPTNKKVQMFFNSLFLSIDEPTTDSENNIMQIEDKSKDYNINLMNAYLLGIMKANLSEKEYDVLRLSYGLDCEKMSAKEIATKLDIQGTASYVRVSQIKKDAIDKLISNVDPSQVIDFL